MEELSRNQLQESAMKIAYEYLTFIDMGSEFDAKQIISDVLETPYDECDDYVKTVSLNIVVHFKEMTDLLDQYLVNWKFSRLNRCAQSILLLAVSSFKYVGNIDKNVIINVAVKLAKKYLDKDEHKFINGVLDKVLC